MSARLSVSGGSRPDKNMSPNTLVREKQKRVNLHDCLFVIFIISSLPFRIYKRPLHIPPATFAEWYPPP